MFSALNRQSVEIFGLPITYTPLNSPGAPLSIRAIFDHNYLGIDENGMQVQVNSPMIHICLSDLGIEPLQGDQVTIKNVNYQVVDVQEDSEGMAKLPLDIL
jgi:hypothetical protein